METSVKREVVTSATKKIVVHCAGDKKDRCCDTPICCSTNQQNDIYYPTLYLNNKQIPELEGFDTEDEVTLVIKGVITSHSSNKKPDSEVKDKSESWDIQVNKIGLIK
ncbi:MAG: hypothetical protein WCW29_04335 [Candidatus Paceibacterota bacterium]|jgi:hypothetical protein